MKSKKSELTDEIANEMAHSKIRATAEQMKQWQRDVRFLASLFKTRNERFDQEDFIAKCNS